MTSTSSPARKLRIFRAVWGVALSYTRTKFLWKAALAHGRRFVAQDANVACRVAGWPCHSPPPAPICLMHGWHPIPWGGWHFHPFLGCISPLVHLSLTNTPTNLSTAITVVNAEPGLISKYHETSADGSSFGTCVPICGVGVDDHESVWVIWLDVLSDTQQLPNVFGPCGK